jgi:RNA polymerase sigma-70 factor (ECF subfamily)
MAEPGAEFIVQSSRADAGDIHALADDELIRLVAHGRQNALAVIFDRYHRLVFSVAARIVRDSGEAEDVVQTVFLDLFRAAATFDPRRGTLRAWVLQYAYHRALNRKRHLVASRFYRREELEAAIESGSNRFLSGELPETSRLAQQMLSKLKPRQRLILQMIYYDGMTAEEVASELGESINVIRHDLYRSLKALRKESQGIV